MSGSDSGDVGPDLRAGVTVADFQGKPLLRGHVDDEAVLLTRSNGAWRAIGATCTHYGGALDQGIVTGDTVHCPLHHACFSLLTGEALAAPAFDPVSCWEVEQVGERIFVRGRAAPADTAAADTSQHPKRIVIIGGGAAGFAAAEMLRRRGFGGELVILSDDADPPCDRPNLSKDYLAGEAPEEWIPLRPDDYYPSRRIDLHLATSVTAIDTAARSVTTGDGRQFAFDRLLIATGAEPVHLPIPGADQPHVFTLRSLADSRAIVAQAAKATTAVVLGSGFIGLETAAALRHRGLSVHVVSLDTFPLERVLGHRLGHFVQSVHEAAGEVFHMGTSIASIGTQSVVLTDGTEIPAGLVIIGVGVRPRLTLAEQAGLSIDHGILVDSRMQTSVPGIYAAGDVARFPAASGDGTLRVEHWVVAERQGQVAADNMLGTPTHYRDTPFFWSAHHDVTIRYVGHAQMWDTIDVDGDLTAGDATVTYSKAGKTVAVATIGRDAVALQQAAALAEAH